MPPDAANPVSWSVADGVALIVIDNPPVNATSRAVRAGLLSAVESAEAEPAAVAIVITGAGRTFTAGGDITEFGRPPLEPHLPDVLDRIESCAKPVVVLWHGTALGGGCEIGLAAHRRLMLADARAGLPEVKLGLVPGAGGTQRLPRLVGQAAAVDLVTSGRMVSAAEALSLGLADRIIAGDLAAGRVAASAEALSLAGSPVRRTGALPRPPATAASAAAADVALRRARGLRAPAEAIRLVTLAGETGIAEGRAEERRTFLALIAGEESRALRHLFLAEREAHKVPGLAGVSPRPVQRVGVIGAGTMGSGIAVAALDSGLAVTVIETSPDALEKGGARIAALYDRSVRSGRIDEGVKAGRLARLTLATDLAALADADLVIEAVFEDMAVKRALLPRLEAAVAADAIIATNTSYLDIDRMAESLARPHRFLGLHFFSPAHVMRLLEIVRAARTAPETLATGLALARRLGKTAVVAGVCDGFIGNRILASTRVTVESLLAEGAVPEEVDAALEGFGFAMGPFAVQDLAGLDIAWARRKALAEEGRIGRFASPLGDALCALGRFGQKTGAGWYRYQDGKRLVDPEVTALVRARQPAGARAVPPQVIVDRVLAAMAEEGGRIVAEGIAARPGDIDLVLVNGYGFPAHRGGPMFQAGLAGG
jgi:3-hydroxyacyl-CoA dehydrogenase